MHRFLAVCPIALLALFCGPVAAQLPFHFEENLGQTDPTVEMLARGLGYSLYLSGPEAVLALPWEHGASVLRISFPGASPTARSSGEARLAGTASHLRGTDPARWIHAAPTFARARVADLYPGIDLVYYGAGSRLEFDFEVAAGVDPSGIELELTGACGIEIDDDGTAQIELEGGALSLLAPRVYQAGPGGRERLESRYTLLGGERLGFEIAAHDPDRPIIIDPVVDYSTYFGGSYIEEGNAVALDAAGNVYFAGMTWSTNFPTASPVQAVSGGNQDAFVAKLDPTGQTLLYATYLGGSADDLAHGIAVDATGSVVVVGETSSTNFPTASALQASYRGSTDAFVTRLAPSGSSFVYSTYLAGSDLDTGAAVAIDALGTAYVTGFTTSVDFPLVSPYQATLRIGGDIYITAIDATGATMLYSTYFGGNSSDYPTAIAVDGAGNVHVAGRTYSPDFPLANPAQGFPGGNADAFALKMVPGGPLVYSTYLGGTGVDRFYGMDLDSAGNALLVGQSRSTNFPTLNAYQPILAGSADMIVTKLDASGALVYSTFLGGNLEDSGFDIAADAQGAAWLTGFTLSGNFPTLNPLQPSRASAAQDVVIAGLSPDGSTLAFSTYFGGYGSDWGTGIAADGAGIVVTGTTFSYVDWPVVNPLQPSASGFEAEAFLTRIKLAIRAGTLIVPQGQVAPGQTGVQIWMAVENPGVSPVQVLAAGLVFHDAAGVDVSGDYVVMPGPGSPTMIAAGATESLAFLVDIDPAAQWGVISIDGQVTVMDTVTGAVHADVAAEVTGSWEVVGGVPVVRTVDAAAATVTPGSSGHVVTVSVEQAGTQGLDVGAVTLTFTGAADRTAEYTVTPDPANPISIAAGTTALFTFAVDVSLAATLELVTLDAAITGSDAGTGASRSDMGADVVDAWTVVGGEVFVRTVDAGPLSVLQGSGGHQVTVTVENFGVNPVAVGAMGLAFMGTVDRTAEYTVTPAPANPTTIAGGATELFTFTVDVAPTASAELITLDAEFTGSDAVTGAPRIDMGADVVDAWTVSGGAALVRIVDAVDDSVLTDTTGHIVTVSVENLGINPITVGAVSLTFSGAADRTSEYAVTTDPGNPTSIAGGATGLFDLWVDVSAGATLEQITLDAGFSGSDAATGAPRDDPAADVTDTWTVVACIATACGDCNGDGQLSILDSLTAAQAGVGVITLTREASANCNVTGLVEPLPGAVVDVLDALTLAQAAAGLPVIFTCC